MEDIIKKCKCGIFLEVNEYRNYYKEIEEAIKEEPAIKKELADRMIKENMFISLQFYPDTPIGSYTIFGTNLDEVISKAKKILWK